MTPADNTNVDTPATGTYPLLEQIDNPEQLRALPQSALPGVCDDIRRFLIDSLSRHPGHFASSMGTVELTVALHYVFNTPWDRIVWDVGHQAYGHKLLTGRRDRFASNRQLGGLSGFPNPMESPYDTFSAGHASNSISAALGMAVATGMNGDTPRRQVVAVIGDASISGGLAFEGLNNAANTPNDLLIILNDNDMSIDPNVGSLHSYLAHITTSPRYNKLRYFLYRALRRTGLLSDNARGRILRFNNSLKALLSDQQNIFEGLNIRYFGPINGHDLGALIRTLRDIKELRGPKLLHIKTIKGKGYAPAEADPSFWHAPGRFDPQTGEPLPSANDKQQPPKYQYVMGKELTALANSNPLIVGITAAMPTGTSMSIMQKEMPRRVFDVGISEGHAVTFAAGLAREGLRPYVAIYSTFLQRAYDHIIHDVALQKLPVTFCIDRAGLVGEDGPTHHGMLDMAYLRSIPGMTLAAPANARELADILYTSQLPERQGPWAIRYPRGRSLDVADVDWQQSPRQAVSVGRAAQLASGDEIAILTTGTVMQAATKAREDALALDHTLVAQYHFPFVKPLDDTMLEQILQRHTRLLTVEDGAVNGGFGSAIEEWLNDHAQGRPMPQVTRLGIPDRFVTQGSVAQLQALCGYDAAGILKAIRAASQTLKPSQP